MTHGALVVADDLTGAMDAGHGFAARGHPTIVAVGDAGATREEGDEDEDEDEEDGGVLVVDTDSRYRSAAEARRAVEAVVRRIDIDSDGVVYKKVDSTLRGNVASETAGALAASGADCALVAPAFPANGRLTAAGHHLVEGALVTDTPAGRDPDAPVETARLPALLAGADVGPVGQLDAGTVAAGPEAVMDAVEESDARLLACDAVHGDHLDALAAGGHRADRSVLYVGSAGLAGAVRLPEADAAPATVPEPPADARVLGVAGSTNPVTVAQVAALPDERVVGLDPERAVTDPEGAARAAADRARGRLGGGVVLSSVQEDGDVAAALRAAERAGLAPDRARERVADALGAAAAAIVEADQPDGLVLTGGAVARAVFEALGADAVALTGEAVAAGIPLGRVRGGAADGAAVVTKAGGFGDDRALADALARLGGDGGA
jgi:uncharacterized protein YgbK (DUF1537 family)